MIDILVLSHYCVPSDRDRSEKKRKRDFAYSTSISQKRTPRPIIVCKIHLTPITGLLQVGSYNASLELKE